MIAPVAPETPLVHPDNIVGSPGSSFAGIAVMAPVLINAVTQLHMPDSATAWLQLAFGVLALLGRG